MAKFRYKALSADGAIVTGEIEASSEAAVIQHLRQLGHYPISASDAAANDWWSWLNQDILPKRRVTQRDLSIATQEMASLLKAGLELDRVLQILIDLEETERLRVPFQGVLARLRDGASLADALAGDTVFPAFYVNLVRAGEMGGSLDVTLHRLADYLSRASATREAVASALVYPAILLVTAGLSIVVIFVFVLPQFEPLFQSAGKSLPLATRVVMGIGHFIGATWWMFLLVGAAGYAYLNRRLREAEFRLRWDGYKLRLPLIGDLLLAMEMERFSRTLGALIGNGVVLPRALNITKETMSNALIARDVGAAATGLREGQGLAGFLSKAGIFPAIVLDLVRVGEETGKLDEMLLRLGDLFEHTVRHKIDRLLALLVPVLTVVLGAIVAGLISSMLVAILSVNDLAF